MNVIDQIEKEQFKESVPELRPGDTIRVHAKVVEGTRERIQVFEGLVIRVTGGALRKNFTVRRVTHGVGVERTFMIHSPRIDKIGKEGRIKERRPKVAAVKTVPVDEEEPEPNGGKAKGKAKAKATAR